MARVPEACRQPCRDCHADYGKPCGTPQKPSPRSDFFLVRELSRDQQQDRQVGRKCVVLLVRGERKKKSVTPAQARQSNSFRERKFRGARRALSPVRLRRAIQTLIGCRSATGRYKL